MPLSLSVVPKHDRKKWIVKAKYSTAFYQTTIIHLNFMPCWDIYQSVLPLYVKYYLQPSPIPLINERLGVLVYHEMEWNLKAFSLEKMTESRMKPSRKYCSWCAFMPKFMMWQEVVRKRIFCNDCELTHSHGKKPVKPQQYVTISVLLLFHVFWAWLYVEQYS